MIKLGVVGAGLMGSAHVKSAKGNPLVEVTAVCDPDLQAASSLAASLGAAAFRSVREMLGGADLQAVIIATPDHLHASPVIECAEAGKAILLEKPFATDPADGRRMMEAIEKSGVTVQMCHIFRWIPFYINMKQAAETGELGRILSANFTMLNKISVPAKMLAWAGNSSPAWFLLSHAIDTVLWVTESPAVRLKATGFKGKLSGMGVDTYDIVKVELTLENGCVCNLEANWILPDTYPITAEVIAMFSGTEGMIYTDTGDPIERKATRTAYSIPGILEFDNAGYHSGVRRNMIESFARTIAYGAPLVTSAADGYNAMNVLCAIDESLKSGGGNVSVNG